VLSKARAARANPRNRRMFQLSIVCDRHVFRKRFGAHTREARFAPANPLCSSLPGFWPAVSPGNTPGQRLSDQRRVDHAAGTLDALHNRELSNYNAKRM
jgi:hypothetical protein